jgi:sodium/hydrogen exchanger 8
VLKYELLTIGQRDFFLNMTTILFYAVLGTLISTAVFGYGLYYLAKAGLVQGIEYDQPLVALQFGSLISATDPVATLSIMGGLRTDPLLYSLIFGESVLNDAIAIVLFKYDVHCISISHWLGVWVHLLENQIWIPEMH